jgi:hypothetical protein
MSVQTFYVTIRLTATVNDDTSRDDIMDRIAADCDYKVALEDDVCKIFDTELLEIS